MQLRKPSVVAILFAVVFTAIPSLADESYQLTNGLTVSPLERFSECDVCPEMIALPLGRFTLGGPREESAQYEDFVHRNNGLSGREPGEAPGWAHEGPVHEVEIDLPFAMGRNEVTYDEWMACVADGGCSVVPNPEVITVDGVFELRDEHPVRRISYLEILEYAAWLNLKVGADVYRLPTEAEWVFAARAGGDTRYIYGDDMPPGIANLKRARFDATGAFIVDPQRNQVLVPVDEMDDENAWGLRHMAGNLMEITMTCFSKRHLGFETSSAYLKHAVSQPSCQRTAKGSAYGFVQFNSRLAFRGRTREAGRTVKTGFRLVRDLSK